MGWIVVFSAIGDVVVTRYLWHVPWTRSLEIPICGSIGLLVAQPSLLAIWCALGSQRLIVRLPLSVGILFGLFCCFVGSMHSLDKSMPLEATVVMLVGASVLFGLIQIPLLMRRRKTGWVLGRPEQVGSATEDGQFHIKHLLLLTTGVAVLVTIAKTVLPDKGFQGGGEPWGQIAVFFLSFIFFASLLAWLTVAIIFYSQRLKASLLAIIAVLVGPVVLVLIMAVVFTGLPNTQIYLNCLAFASTLFLADMLVLYFFHCLGYRYVQGKH